ncbi:MAG TPA: oxidoreductase [Solimonas sp.]|nr:oxidoreductase [Solimonas sp.]
MAHWTLDDIPRLDGRLAVVTGANSGLGLHTATALAGKGARVVLACRDAGKAATAMQQIRQQQPTAQLQFEALDLSDLGSVREFAQELQQRESRLDLLCNNAGVMALPLRRTREGFEMQFGTNHLGHFALTGLLLPLLQATPGARVVTVSSLAHHLGRIRLDDLNWQRGYSKWPAYAQSKLANLMFALELGRRLQKAGQGVLSLAAHPGYAATNLQFAGPAMENSGFGRLAMKLGNAVFSQPADAGAWPTLRAATAADVSNGQFYGPRGFQQVQGPPGLCRTSRAAQDKLVATQLWTLSEELTGVGYLSD